MTLLNLNDTRYLTGYQFNAGTPANPAAIFNLPELPPGRMGAYNQGRVWQSGANGISFIAGDIVGGPSGSPS